MLAGSSSIRCLIRGASLVAVALFLAGVALLGQAGTAHADSTPATPCSWPIKNDPDAINAAWPDEDASYWAAPFYSTPATEITIRGEFPLARYMSFHVYEGGAAVSAVTDYQIAPSSGINPYEPGARRVSGGSYALHLVFGQKPADPAPNTLYAASLNGEPNVAGVIIYRLYLPEGDSTGGVPLPQVDYTNAATGLPLPCPDTSALDSSTLNQQIVAGSLPTDTTAAPSTDLSWGVVNSHTSSSQTIGTTTVRTGYDGYFGNLDNAYLSLEAYRNKGAVLAFRAKAPTFAQTAGAATMPSGRQVRYWSICSDEFATTRYIACVDDSEVHIDRDGYFTIVMSDAAHKPDNLLPTDTWLPEGPFPDEFVLYRQLIASPTFAESIANAVSNAAAAKSMGSYYPETVQCSETDFEKNRCGLPAGPASTSRPGPSGNAPSTHHAKCAAVAERLGADRLGPARLGVARSRQRIALPRYHVTANPRFDDICLSPGAGIRVGYLAAKRGATSTAVLAMTGNHRFSFRHVRAGTTLRTALRELGPHLSGPLQRGHYSWYALSGPLGSSSTFVLETRARKVVEIGIASPKLSSSAAKLRHLLSDLRA
jgi:hypothetical protein